MAWRRCAASYALAKLNQQGGRCGEYSIDFNAKKITFRSFVRRHRAIVPESASTAHQRR
jgi:hypothetical protein